MILKTTIPMISEGKLNNSSTFRRPLSLPPDGGREVLPSVRHSCPNDGDTREADQTEGGEGGEAGRLVQA